MPANCGRGAPSPASPKKPAQQWILSEDILYMDSRKPVISLCMIVRDEADMLPGCLESVRGLVGEVVAAGEEAERPGEELPGEEALEGHPGLPRVILSGRTPTREATCTADDPDHPSASARP